MKTLIYTVLIFTLVKCSSCPSTEQINSSCLSSIVNKLNDDSFKEIDFGFEINCFQWDSLEVGGRGSYKNYPCTNFTLIEKYDNNGLIVKGSNLESKMDWFDRDRHWQMIYFYNDGHTLNEALAISQSAVSFTDMTFNKGSIFLNKSESKFKISDRILGGFSNKELIEHRQMIKK